MVVRFTSRARRSSFVRGLDRSFPQCRAPLSRISPQVPGSASRSRLRWSSDQTQLTSSARADPSRPRRRASQARSAAFAPSTTSAASMRTGLGSPRRDAQCTPTLASLRKKSCDRRNVSPRLALRLSGVKSKSKDRPSRDIDFGKLTKQGASTCPLRGRSRFDAESDAPAYHVLLTREQATSKPSKGVMEFAVAGESSRGTEGNIRWGRAECASCSGAWRSVIAEGAGDDVANRKRRLRAPQRDPGSDEPCGPSAGLDLPGTPRHRGPGRRRSRSRAQGGVRSPVAGGASG